jgi:hypothetical protein
MYAICENTMVAGGVRSADQHGAEWWTGRRWSPASDEAKVYEEAADAEREAADLCDRDYTVVEID